MKYAYYKTVCSDYAPFTRTIHYRQCCNVLVVAYSSSNQSRSNWPKNAAAHVEFNSDIHIDRRCGWSPVHRIVGIEVIFNRAPHAVSRRTDRVWSVSSCRVRYSVAADLLYSWRRRSIIMTIAWPLYNGTGDAQTLLVRYAGTYRRPELGGQALSPQTSLKPVPNEAKLI